MKRNIFFSLLLMGTVFFYSCTQDPLFENTIEEERISLLKESHFVSLEKALHIADLQKSGLTKGPSTSDFLEFKKTSDLAEFYIINYSNTGFIIISGDDRLTPVLAYSENSHFPLRESNVPYGVTDWLNTMSAVVDSIRRTDMSQDFTAKYDWESTLSGKQSCFSEIKDYNPMTKDTDISVLVWEYGQDLDHDDCGIDGGVLAEYYIYVPQLLITEWGQEDGYNEAIPWGGCTTTLNGRYPVGCVAVAVGQVMLHNRYPSSFNWNAIYNYGLAYGTATNEFLRDLGLPGNLNMMYGCSGSGAYDSDAVNYLRSVGYTSTSITSSVMPAPVMANLRYGYPVIMRGGTTNGHMWVCDGIKSYYNIVCFAAGGCYDTRSEINLDKQYYHMNWGWYDRYIGWFSMVNFTPGSHNFNSNKKLIYNIKP